MNLKENRLVVANIGWAETLPEWILEEIKAERLIYGLASILKPDAPKVGDAEATAYLYTLSLTQPLDHELTEIFLYLAGTIMKKRGMKITEEMKEKLERGLTADEERELKELKDKIYSKRGGDIKHPIIDMMKQFNKEMDKLPKNNLKRWC